jgi:filamentous hemagglutinin
MAQAIKGATEGHEPANLMAHAVWDALAAQLSGANATAGAAGAFSGELAARHIGAEMFPDTKLGDLNQDQKQLISLLGTMAAGIAGGVVGAASAGAVGYNTRGSVGRDGESWDEVGGGCEGTREQCAVRDGIRDGTRGPGHVMNGDGSEENSQPNVGKSIAKATDKEKAELGGTGSGTGTPPPPENEPKQQDGKPVEKLSQKQESAIKKIDNTIKNALKDHDITGTIKDMDGNPVPKENGGYWNHIQEMQNTLRGLRNHAGRLKNVNNPEAQAAYGRATDAINKIESALKGHGK